MARYVLLNDLTFEGLPYKRGDVLNAPQGLPAVVAASAELDAVPRARPAGLEFYPDNYKAIASDADRLGYQHADKSFPPDASGDSNVIPEPRLPTENAQYE